MPRKSSFSNEERQNIIKLYQEGKSSVEIATAYNRKAPCIASLLKRAGIDLRSNKENSRRYTVNHNYFNAIDNEHKAYWLGFMYADGFVPSDKDAFGINLAVCDINHLEKFNADLESDYNVKIYTQSSGYVVGSEYCRLIIYSNQLKKDLIKHGCIENKTYILKPPKLNRSLYKHFIRGFLEGDGCITHSLNSSNSYDWKIKICGTEDMLDFIKAFIEENNVAKINKYYKRKKHQVVSNIDFGGNRQVLKFLNLIYDDATIYLDRKYKQYIEFINYINSRA